MRFKREISIALTALIALAWLINGLFCKVLNMVPRHQLIVSRILGAEHALLFTKVIGVLEILMVVWILSKINSRFCAIVQICVVAIMNILEFTLVPNLLLFGKVNIAFASLFILIIYLNEFQLIKKADIAIQ